MTTYDSRNCILTIDDIELCNKSFISGWVNDNIDVILSSDDVVRLDFRDGKMKVEICVICQGFLVAIYIIKEGQEDEFWIQHAGYDHFNY